MESVPRGRQHFVVYKVFPQPLSALNIHFLLLLGQVPSPGNISLPDCLEFQIDLNLNEKRQSADASTSMTQALELSNKGFQAAFVKVQQLQTIDANEEVENLSREREDIKKIQMEILGLKNITTQNKVKKLIGLVW